MNQPNHWLQATRDCALVFILAHWPRVPEPAPPAPSSRCKPTRYLLKGPSGAAENADPGVSPTLFLGEVPNASEGLRRHHSRMNNVVGLTLFALGIVLLIVGFNASQSFGSDVSRFFTGNPTDKSMWLLIGGAVTVVAGLVLSIRGVRKG